MSIEERGIILRLARSAGFGEAIGRFEQEYSLNLRSSRPLQGDLIGGQVGQSQEKRVS